MNPCHRPDWWPSVFARARWWSHTTYCSYWVKWGMGIRWWLTDLSCWWMLCQMPLIPGGSNRRKLQLWGSSQPREFGNYYKMGSAPMIPAVALPRLRDRRLHAVPTANSLDYCGPRQFCNGGNLHYGRLSAAIEDFLTLSFPSLIDRNVNLTYVWCFVSGSAHDCINLRSKVTFLFQTLLFYFVSLIYP